MECPNLERWSLFVFHCKSLPFSHYKKVKKRITIDVISYSLGLNSFRVKMYRYC